jgi:undecaprenyl-diphosphatase
MKNGIIPEGTERRAGHRNGLTERVRDALFPLLRWIERHVRGFYGALGLFLSIGLTLGLLAIGAFALLAELMAKGATQAFDDAVLLWLYQYRTPWLDVAALEVTALGAGLVVWMTLMVASAFLWATRHKLSVLLLWVAVVGGGILNTALKAMFDRPRPQLVPWATAYAGHSSFPSGHAMTAVIVYTTLAYLVARLEPTPLLRRLTLGMVAVVILMIGLSRLYLGVHYPSDVLAGFVAGFAWATFCAAGIQAIHYFRHRKPEVQEAERDLDAEGEQARGERA